MSRPASQNRDRPSSSRQPSRADSSSSRPSGTGNGNGNGSARQPSAGPSAGQQQQPDSEEVARRPRPPPLPAVKGTIGGIESPRRAHLRNSPSVSTIAGDAATPSTIGFPQNGHAGSEQGRTPNPNAPVFRIDPNLRTTFDSLNLDSKDELKRLFGLA